MKKRRVILKLSDETLTNANGKGYDKAVVRGIARQVKRSVNAGIKVGIVIGGGNCWKGKTGMEIARVKADQIGMLAAIMNCIYVSEIFRSEGMETEMFSPFLCDTTTELLSVDKASALFAAGRVLFFAGGTGHPYFSTDAEIALWATKLGVDKILLTKLTDGVYTADPKLDPGARHYDTLIMQEMIDKELGIIDLTASVFCVENKIPLAVFDLHDDNAIADALRGVIHGTMVMV